jgi:hypothetical protein
MCERSFDSRIGQTVRHQIVLDLTLESIPALGVSCAKSTMALYRLSPAEAEVWQTLAARGQYGKEQPVCRGADSHRAQRAGSQE